MEWVRISLQELQSLEDLPFEWCSQPFIELCYNKVGYLILGRDTDIEGYYVGIPDIYDPKQKFILAYDGSERFKFRNEEAATPGSYGYWIARR